MRIFHNDNNIKPIAWDFNWKSWVTKHKIYHYIFVHCVGEEGLSWRRENVIAKNLFVKGRDAYIEVRLRIQPLGILHMTLKAFIFTCPLMFPKALHLRAPYQGTLLSIFDHFTPQYGEFQILLQREIIFIASRDHSHNLKSFTYIS